MLLTGVLLLSFTKSYSPQLLLSEEKQITITMPESAWVTVLNALQQIPYKESAPIINFIQASAQKQLTDTTTKKH